MNTARPSGKVQKHGMGDIMERPEVDCSGSTRRRIPGLGRFLGLKKCSLMKYSGEKREECGLWERVFTGFKRILLKKRYSRLTCLLLIFV